jgi:L-ascorbate metabolism protein UlaG (beta-lactamase superfamily)
MGRGEGGLMHPRDFEARTDFAPGSPVGAGELSIRWFGTAAYRLEYAGKVLWIDPWFSRQGLLTLRRGVIEPVTEEIDKYMDRADAIVIGHSHYDHAADLPYIAPKTGAVVHGSESTANLLRAHAIDESQISVVAGGGSVEEGPFKIAFVPSAHGSIMGKVPGDFDIGPDIKPPLKAGEYGHGGVFGLLVDVDGYRIYHKGSAALVEENEREVRADLLLLGISIRADTERFVYRVVQMIDPRILMPMHYDYFFRRLSKGLRLVPRTRFDQVVDEAREAKPEIEIVTLPLLGEYRLRPQS